MLGVVVVGVLLPSEVEGEPFPDGEGVAGESAVAVAALTVTATFMPPVQCPGTAHTK